MEPLAQKILEQDPKGDYPVDMAEAFVDAEKGVGELPRTHFQGAMDIIAETISDDASIRRRLRVVTADSGCSECKETPRTRTPFTHLLQFQSGCFRLAGHRVLAIDRGEKERILKASVKLDGNGPTI